MRAEMLRDGFFTLLPSDWAVDFAAMRAGVAKIVAAGWPAPLLLVYDEVWAIAHQLSSLMAAVSGGNRNSLDMLAWSVCAARGEAGFAPHRDRQPADVAGSFHPGGEPKYATAWVAISEASAEAGCLYLVPRGVDPGYDAGDDHSADADDPLMRVFRSSDAAVQAVRGAELSR